MISKYNRISNIIYSFLVVIVAKIALCIFSYTGLFYKHIRGIAKWLRT